MPKISRDTEQAFREIRKYIDDAKRAGFFSALEYVASHPAAGRCLNVAFNLPMSEKIDAWDILDQAGLHHLICAPGINPRKDLDMLVLLGTLKKYKTMYLPSYSITLEGHDVCVTYQNLVDVARRAGFTKDCAGKMVYDWVCGHKK